MFINRRSFNWGNDTQHFCNKIAQLWNYSFLINLINKLLFVTVLQFKGTYYFLNTFVKVKWKRNMHLFHNCIIAYLFQLFILLCVMFFSVFLYFYLVCFSLFTFYNLLFVTSYTIFCLFKYHSLYFSDVELFIYIQIVLFLQTLYVGDDKINT